VVSAGELLDRITLGCDPASCVRIEGLPEELQARYDPQEERKGYLKSGES
jgi:hypothetical protein